MSDKVHKYKDEYDDIHLTEQHLDDIVRRVDDIRHIRRSIKYLDNLLEKLTDSEEVFISVGSAGVNYGNGLDLPVTPADIPKITSIVSAYRHTLMLEMTKLQKLNPEHKDY